MCRVIQLRTVEEPKKDDSPDITGAYRVILNVVKEWDKYIRSVTEPWSTWYPRYDSTGLSFRNYTLEVKDRDKAYQEAENAKNQFIKILKSYVSWLMLITKILMHSVTVSHIIA